MTVTSGAAFDPNFYLRARTRWHPIEYAFWASTLLPFLLFLVLVRGGGELTPAGHTSGDWVRLLLLALFPGLIALLLYYRALSKTPASLATIAEMAYPVAATLIFWAPPPWGFNQPVYPAQVIGTALLLAVILILNWSKENAPPVVQAATLTPAEG